MFTTRYARGLTLIELLIALAVISLLAAVCLPALSAARDNARSVTCLSSLRQTGIAMACYTADFSGYSVPNDLDPLPGSAHILAWQAYLWRHYLDQQQPVFQCPAQDSEAQYNPVNPTLQPAYANLSSVSYVMNIIGPKATLAEGWNLAPQGAAPEAGLETGWSNLQKQRRSGWTGVPANAPTGASAPAFGEIPVLKEQAARMQAIVITDHKTGWVLDAEGKPNRSAIGSGMSAGIRNWNQSDAGYFHPDKPDLVPSEQRRKVGDHHPGRSFNALRADGRATRQALRTLPASVWVAWER